MDNPSGTIHAIVTDEHGMRATVDVDAAAVCARCAAGKGCGAGLSLGSGTVRRVEASVDPGMTLAAGDQVELVLATDKILRATLIVYGLPLLGAVVAASVAYLLGLGDAAATLAAIIGVATGLLVARRRLRQTDCLQHFVPHVGKRLPAPGMGG
jgi:sigma-E factor negative regulatory protein RseC